ncbi:CRISPR-associated endoribonuclease Cas6 [Calothrix sp. 336/3]|uniref:CRISPR-associated endoribonuclease Cas6 n=1 Tax=Calothrix sp. 336/3 TaxID=1337936 RepID=UPI0004E34BE9|nr:CRISPR-associated endoribonuclease Cas6 [Calothrix sp. 336/3]AKG22042.1 CRISPR-associated protein Cas6 [Calothrix sp. 336/3]
MPAPQRSNQNLQNLLNASTSTELVTLAFDVTPVGNLILFPEYAIGLHAWFLDQVRQSNPELSQYLHDGESEKPFAISRLEGEIATNGKQQVLIAQKNYRWYVSALSQNLVQWMADWLGNLPANIELRTTPLQIQAVSFAHPPTSYAQLLQQKASKNLALSFISPTSFRRKAHHFPLPLPFNVFQSYLRRWNDFSGHPVDGEKFLEWVDNHVIITRHQIATQKVPAGKRGMLTGFIGSVEFTLTTNAAQHPEYGQLFHSLGQLAPYCGTGHKTTFGLGQTRLGWLQKAPEAEAPNLEASLAQRIAQLTEIFMQQQKRTGGERAISVCQTRATILARREIGEPIKDIAASLNMNPETVKTYIKLARRALAES